MKSPIKISDIHLITKIPKEELQKLDIYRWKKEERKLKKMKNANNELTDQDDEREIIESMKELNFN